MNWNSVITTIINGKKVLVSAITHKTKICHNGITLLHEHITFRPLEIANWGPNQPTFKNGTKSKCGAFDGTETSERTPHEDAKYGYWYNLKCDTKFQALCQKTSKVAPPKSEYESYSCPNVRFKDVF